MTVLDKLPFKPIQLKALLFLGFLFLWMACSSPLKLYTFSGQTMGTTYSVKIVSENSVIDHGKIQKGIDSVLTLVNQHLSIWDPNSEISQFNQNRQQVLIVVSPHLRNVISKSLEISEATKGAFDITVFDLMSLWGFGPNPKEGLPTDAQIEELKNRTGYQNIILEPKGVRKLNPDLKLDVNAIAKGYGVDQVFEWILEQGFESVFVEIGGEVRCAGKNQNGQHWRVGIIDPEISASPGEELSAVVNLDGKAMATSGNYRNFIEINGQILGHTIDPRTGYPVETDVLSVSVITNSCMEADGWATALMVLNFEEGNKLVSDRKELNALWIVETMDGQRKIEKTEGFIIENPKY